MMVCYEKVVTFCTKIYYEMVVTFCTMSFNEMVAVLCMCSQDFFPRLCMYNNTNVNCDYSVFIS